MESIDDTPDPTLMSTLLNSTTKEEKQAVFHSTVRDMLRRIVNLPVQLETSSTIDTSDGIYNYVQELISLGLVYAEFEDAIREGDGIRVLRVWKFLLLIFKAAHRKNYSIEALTLIVQYLTLPPRQREQLIWSRFVNTKGRPGGNKASDLHMEHLNRTI